MKAVGIIAEYNPFHNGHKYLIEKAKEITEDDLKTLEKDIQKATDDAVKEIDQHTANKEEELLTVWLEKVRLTSVLAVLFYIKFTCLR